MNTSFSNQFTEQALLLHNEGKNMDQITLQLKENGAPENLLQEALHYLKQMRLIRKRNTGFACCGIGVALLVVGCIITIMMYNTGGDIKLAMYGLTTLGVGFTIKGLIDLLGW